MRSDVDRMDAADPPLDGRANIFTVPPGRPFLRSLAAAILAGDLPASGGARPDPLDLPGYTILLPTNRAARALQEAFLDETGGRAMLLPRIRPIAMSDEDEGLISIAAGGRGDSDLVLPPAIDPLERQLVLTRLVMAWSAAVRGPGGAGEAGIATVKSAGAGTPAQAAHLARDLARLMDAVETENVALSRLEGLVPDALSSHWQQTLEFLKVITVAWPTYLEERGHLSAMDRRNRLILAEVDRIERSPPTSPLIVAGVTGSVPATARLMRAVARTPYGAIVLPAIDVSITREIFDSIGKGHPEHPQYGFHRLLTGLGIDRERISELAGRRLDASRLARNRLFAEALQPAGALGSWRELGAELSPDQVRSGLGGVSLVEAATAEEEAETIALILREAAEKPGLKAALVSPDRLLARRVAIRLAAFGIRVDDSAGRPFAKTLPGTFLDLVTGAAEHRMAPADLMALLKHPLTRLGLSAGAVRRAARALEITVFRAPYLGSGLADLEAALERAGRAIEAGARRHRAMRGLDQRAWNDMRDLVRRVAEAFGPLLELAERPLGDTIGLSDLCRAHIATAEAIARPEDAEPGSPSPLWQGEAGETAARLFGNLMQDSLPAPPLSFEDYPDFYRALIASETVRSRVPVHPRLSIWGPLEARLQQPDIVVLGSLNEGTWPAASDPGAWLNRPMRTTLGLPSPEEEIGRAAHDFISLAGADRVIMTRAAKVDGVPTVPSRWLLRLKALLGGLGANDALTPKSDWLAWARNRDHISRRRQIRAPEPKPPLELRPRGLSLSDVETWMANPYAIFARHILRLEAMPPIGMLPGPAEKGQILHEAVSRFAKQYPKQLPNDVAAELMTVFAGMVDELGAEPRVRAFWGPRFRRFAEWFAETEPARRNGVLETLAEIEGKEVLETPGGGFTLRGRADRIDVTQRGIVITDYKTGSPPAESKVIDGFAPQLPLEAAMAIAGAFTGLPSSSVIGLRYIRASGGEPPGVDVDLKLKDTSPSELAAQARQGLADLIRAFDDPATPYRAVRRRDFKYDYDDYAGLARIAEWAHGSDDGEAEEPA